MNSKKNFDSVDYDFLAARLFFKETIDSLFKDNALAIQIQLEFARATCHILSHIADKLLIEFEHQTSPPVHYTEGLGGPLPHSNTSITLDPVQLQDVQKDALFSLKNLVTPPLAKHTESFPVNISANELANELLSNKPFDEKIKLINFALSIKNGLDVVNDAMAACCSTNVELTLKLINARPSFVEELDDKSIIKLFDKKHGVAVEKIQLQQRLKSILIERLSNKEQITSLLDSVGDEMAHDLVRSLSFSELNATSVLFQERPELYDYVSDSQKIRDAGHHLGLKGDQFEGNMPTLSNQSTKKRFRELTKTTSQNSLAFKLIHDNSFTVMQHLKTHGDFIGIQAGWKGHGFSFHFVQDNDKLHIVYVNRGQKDELANPNDPAVSVFTVPNDANAYQLIQELHDELKTADRKKISNFIHTKLIPHRNPEASAELAKSNQKVGNCSIANANIAWHFKLASDLMKQNKNVSFPVAYKQSAEAYKAMRMDDRAQAFLTLVRLRGSCEKPEQFHDSVMQVVEKMSAKDTKNPTRQTVSILVAKLAEQEPEGLKQVLEQIILDPKTKNVPEKVQWVKAIAQYLPDGEEKQKAIVYLKTNKSAAEVPAFLNNLTPEQSIEQIGKADPAMLKAFIHSFEVTTLSLKPEKNQMALIAILKYDPNYIKYASREIISWLLNKSFIQEERKSLCKQLLERRAIDKEDLQYIVSNWDCEDAKRFKHILLYQPELINYATPDFIKTFLAKEDLLTQTERTQFISHLQKSTLKTVTDILDISDPVDKQLSRLLESSRSDRLEDAHENSAAKSVAQVTIMENFKKDLASLKSQAISSADEKEQVRSDKKPGLPS